MWRRVVKGRRCPNRDIMTREFDCKCMRWLDWCRWQLLVWVRATLSPTVALALTMRRKSSFGQLDLGHFDSRFMHHFSHIWFVEIPSGTRTHF